MAKEEKAEEVILEDQKKLKIKPLAIKPLRQFLKVYREGLTETDENGVTTPKATTDDDFLTIYVHCAAIGLSESLHNSVNGIKKNDQFENPSEYSEPTSEYLDYLENNLNTHVGDRILEVCGGIATESDPKLAEAMAQVTDG